ncbi:MAG: hypothetical protein K0R84_1029 [Clostridia bacterium]|nr:hypothetical protein [Clostridia bacterium]
MMVMQEEKLLLELKTDYDNITIPSNIDDFILQGIKAKPKAKKAAIILRYSATAAAIALFLLAAASRISPVFADYLDDVPVLKYIVKLVNYDKGLKAAIENNFVQNIGVSDEHAGIKFTVDSVIVDEARMIIFYTIGNNSKYKPLDMYNVKLTDKYGKNLEASYNLGFMADKAEAKKIQDKINVSFAEGLTIPDIVHLEAEFRESSFYPNIGSNPLPYKWEVDIPIDKSKFERMKQVYQVNKTIEVEGQRITINRTTVYPTRIAVDISFAEDNTMKIFNFEDAKIVNAKGEILPTIMNDVYASHISDNEIMLYFESDYFSKPEDLYLQIGSIRALDKDKSYMLVDIDKEELLQAPDERLVLKSITRLPNETTLTFLLDGDEFRENQTRYQISAAGVYDDTGKQLKQLSSSSSYRAGEDSTQEISITIENTDWKSPIKVMLNDYPNRIKGDFKIPIKQQ